MKKRFIYSLLFGVPGFFVAGGMALLIYGGLAGIFWLFIYGDNSWPAYSETILSLFLLPTFLLLWIASIALGYRVGKRLEPEQELNRSHILISVGLTFLFLVFLLLQQWSVGNFGPRSESLLCSEFCAGHGYSGSGIPPENSGDRSCSCYDDSGNQTLRIPLDHLSPEISR